MERLLSFLAGLAWKYLGSWLFFLAICSSPNSIAQELSLDQAVEFTKQGRHQSAVHIYDQLLQQDPNHYRARLERGVLRSWAGEYGSAESDFSYLLKNDPTDHSVRNSYGYSLAWSGNYVSAESQFRKVLISDPNHLDARKGLAYVALWKGMEKMAVNRFERLVADDSGAEMLVGLGQSYLLAGQQKKARRAFEKALQVNPQQTGGLDLLRGAQIAPAYLEFTLWSGYSSVGDENKWGLRAGEVALQPNHKWRFWLKYDNSLALDNLGLIQSQQGAPGYFAGALATWKQKFSTKLETGTRILPEGVRQMIYQGEQVAYLKHNISLKAGGLWAPKNNGEKEWMGYGGFSFPASEALTFEPLYFYSKNLNSRNVEQRFQLNGYYKLPHGFQINGGILYGQSDQTEVAMQVPIYGGNLLVVMPLGHVHWLSLLLRYESSQAIDFFTASLGLKFRLER